MSDDQAAGFGWLPAGVQRRLAAEEGHERAAAKRAQAERADRADQKREAALNLYRQQAEARGEVVSAMALASGEGLGRTVADIFGSAVDAANREDARAAARQRHEDGEVVFIDRKPVIHGASRSAWPESEWELDRMLREAGELHRDLVQAQARLASRQGRAAEHIEAQRAAAERGHVQRSAPVSPGRAVNPFGVARGWWDENGEIYR